MAAENWSRVVTLTEGTAMVVTDLHGDWDTYRICRETFIRGFRAGEIRYLIFSGDLIHRELPPQDDKSLEIILDVLRLQQTYPGAVIYVCGNHEMPHIYGVILAKGEFVYTPRFEAALGKHRKAIIQLFRSLPFYVRTRAGVAITHAGAAAPLSLAQNCSRVFTFSHQDVFERLNVILRGQDLESLRNGLAKVAGESYLLQAQEYLAVTGADDPRYDDLLRGILVSNDPDFELLWAALFTRCEKEYGEADYGIFLHALLQALSVDFYPQNLLVAGHLKVENGYKVVAGRHLRIASGEHAIPLNSARYLCFDTGRPETTIEDLLGGLRLVTLQTTEEDEW
jgi:hypothetical protein